MIKFFEECKSLLDSNQGIADIQHEMAKQANDAMLSVKTATKQLNKFIEALKLHRQLLLLGMGASHYVNKIFSLQLRKLGINALAMSAADYLSDPFDNSQCPILLTSQSGESIEVIQCLDILDTKNIFGLTLTEGSSLAQRSCSIIAAGGTEKAYAGTRSVTISLALLAAIASKLGAFDLSEIHSSLAYEYYHCSLEVRQAAQTMAQAKQIVVVGRSLYAAVAQLFCLGCQELSQQALYAYEIGQFRHGPIEVLDQDSLLIFFRQSGRLGAAITSIQQMQRSSNCTLLVIDSSGLEPLPTASTIASLPGENLATVLALLPLSQLLMIYYACLKNPHAGIPRYSSKVTTIA